MDPVKPSVDVAAAPKASPSTELSSSAFSPVSAPASMASAAPTAVYRDFEAEGSQVADMAVADSLLEDRVGLPVERHVQVASGDTLVDVLVRGGVEDTEANQAVNSLKGFYNPRSLKAGQRVTLAFSKPLHGLGIGDLTKVSLHMTPAKEISAQRTDDGGFQGGEEKLQLNRQVARFNGTIQGSLFGSAQKAGIPVPVINAMIRALSYDVDFQRDVQPGTPFDVVFEGYYDSRGKLVRHGDMLYAAISVNNETISMYRFETDEGSVEYFNAKGESIKKALLKTPVDGARLSSGYGMRRHPILGYGKMHKGVDFAVPTGTPIQSAGDGVIEEAGNKGGYGNYVRVRHSGGYATAYAHMSRIATGMRPGKRVKQGQIVGYVGSTGRSTGPHLHYEVLMGNQHINPLKVKMSTTTRLAGRELERFKQVKRQVEDVQTTMPGSNPTRVATLSSKAKN